MCDPAGEQLRRIQGGKKERRVGESFQSNLDGGTRARGKALFRELGGKNSRRSVLKMGKRENNVGSSGTEIFLTWSERDS